jgi:hypothetical protein
MQRHEINTGLDVLNFLHFPKLTIPDWHIGDTEEALRAIVEYGYATGKDQSVPEHIRATATWAANLAEGALDDIETGKKKGVDLRSSINGAVMVGMLYQRCLLWQSERPARVGRPVIDGPKKLRGQRKSGSLPQFISSIDGWKKKSKGQIVGIVRKKFPTARLNTIDKAIRRLKK